VPVVYEIEESLAANLPNFITDEDITVLRRRAESARVRESKLQI